VLDSKAYTIPVAVIDSAAKTIAMTIFFRIFLRRSILPDLAL
jgi:hypothetical protein